MRVAWVLEQMLEVIFTKGVCVGGLPVLFYPVELFQAADLPWPCSCVACKGQLGVSDFIHCCMNAMHFNQEIQVDGEKIVFYYIDK